MGSRQAIDTIRGYFYQFDYTILSILLLENDADTTTIEGIEDVDIVNDGWITAVQCKYYSKTEYNHSVIGKPIRLMLQEFKKSKENQERIVTYKLYGHFKKGQSKLSLPISLDFLKDSLLTYTKDKKKLKEHEDLSLTDQDLNEFLANLIIDINAMEYKEQYDEVIRLLMEKFQCDLFTAENYYYNNALKVIKDHSVLDREEERVISKKDFLTKINNQKILFNKWYILLKGKEKLLAEVKKKYFTKLNISPFERFFLIESDVENYDRSELKDIILKISQNWTNISRRKDNPYCPYIHIYNLPDQELVEIKKEFRREGLKFIDGFDFQGSDFSVDSILKQANHSNEIKIKLINEMEYITQIIDRTTKTVEIYQFYINDTYFNLGEDYSGTKHVQIQVENINDIGDVI